MLIGSRTSGGVVKISVGTNGEGYASRPDVLIVGGGGTGVSAVAHMAGTRVESIIVTERGTGFTGNPSVVIQPASAAVTISAATPGESASVLEFDPPAPSTEWERIVVGGQTLPVGFISVTAATISATTASTGEAILYAAGTGAAATAYAYTGPLRPMTFFKGRFGDVYGVDGMGRGIRWTGGTASASPLGLHKPAIGPRVVPTASTDVGKYVSSIQLVDSGAGYASAPTVTLTGGTPDRPATARAAVINGRVAAVRVSDKGAGYQEPPTVSFSGGVGQGGFFTVGVAGRVRQFTVANGGTGYDSDSPPVLTVASSNGLTGFNAQVFVGEDGRVSSVAILSAGTGATTTPTFSVTADTGSGAMVAAQMAYAVKALTVADSGAGYYTPPLITFRPAPQDLDGGRASAECEVSSSGHITAATIISEGEYNLPPSAFVADSGARAQASLSFSMRGKYRCAIRYIDDTPADKNGPTPSSISETTEVDAEEGSDSLVWSFDHPYVDDRVTAMELWRTSGDQAVLLFRVATIDRTDPQWDSTYTDTLNDFELTKPTRDGYGLMPITLPSGQINARRFAVPPGEFAVAAMFQDRAWYAVDTTGRAPNSLYYSEVDEPESVPLANELIVQENTDTPDKVVALIPLAAALLVVQSSHVYKLMYVAQPILDASILLVAHRGVLNSRCWAVMAGVAFLVDSVGMYAFDGGAEQSISAAVDNFWRDRIIDFSKSHLFHVSADHLSRTVRFFYCKAGDEQPTRALCYCTATQAWWEEVYGTAVTANVPVHLGGQLRPLQGCADGVWRKSEGSADGSAPVAYALRTGNFPLADEPDRSIDVMYEPTEADQSLAIGLHYNNSASPRPSAISAERGSGFTVAAGGDATLNLKRSRSALGSATGVARAYYAGRRDERSAGGDQAVAVSMGGSQSGSERVSVYALTVRGVK
jgi:hypothetical protein